MTLSASAIAIGLVFLVALVGFYLKSLLRKQLTEESVEESIHKDSTPGI